MFPIEEVGSAGSAHPAIANEYGTVASLQIESI
jgi:hypothetical protein